MFVHYSLYLSFCLNVKNAVTNSHEISDEVI